jgi:hypothetical protein
MITTAVINKKTNRVVNIVACESIESVPQENESYKFEQFSRDIHPWGQDGFIDIEPGLGWQEKYIPLSIQQENLENI